MIFYLMAIIILITACDKNSDAVPTLTDVDGNEYDTVKIGILFFTKQNLKTSHYRNGDRIPEITSPELWSSLTSGAWCWYNNDSVKYAAIYGKLYNWYAVNDPRGLVPEGWHVPSDTEWTALSLSLGDDLVAGGQMKESGTSHWSTPNTGATNSTGFTGLPGGYRDNLGSFSNIGMIGGWWSSTQSNTDDAWFRNLNYLDGNLYRLNPYKKLGFSIRCTRD